MTLEKFRPTFPFTQERLAALQAVIPEAFADGKLNWETLRQVLGEHLEEEGADAEHFGLTWPGKRAARRLAATPSPATLIPAPGEGVDEATTRNLFLEGDNLEVLKLLQKSYAGRVKLIYIDPPYNTGNDFIYKDDFNEPLESYLRRTGQTGEAGELLTTNPKAGGRFHSNWLNMIYPRLLLARQLLTDNGLFVISIDDNEIGNLLSLMDEVLGEENRVGVLIWKRRQQVDSRTKNGLSRDHEYSVIYRKQEDGKIKGSEKDLTKYSNPDNDPRGAWSSDNLLGLATKEQRPNLHYDLIDLSTLINYGCPETGWRYNRESMSKLIADNRILWPASSSGRPRLKRFQNELESDFTGLSSVLNTAYSSQATLELKELFDGKDIFDFPKPSSYLKLILEQTTQTDTSDIILDFFSGAATTAHAVLQLNHEDGGNRRFILVQLPEATDNPQFPTIAEIGKERIRRVSQRLKVEAAGKLINERETPEDLGFKVLKLARSHFKPFDATPPPQTPGQLSQLATLFDAAESPLVADWQAENLLVEILLHEGFPLDSRMEVQEYFQQNWVWKVESAACGHRLFVCLDERLHPTTITGVEQMHNAIFICLDAAVTDQEKLQLTDRGRVKVI